MSDSNRIAKNAACLLNDEKGPGAIAPGPLAFYRCYRMTVIIRVRRTFGAVNRR